MLLACIVIELTPQTVQSGAAVPTIKQLARDAVYSALYRVNQKKGYRNVLNYIHQRHSLHASSSIYSCVKAEDMTAHVHIQFIFSCVIYIIYDRSNQ